MKSITPNKKIKNVRKGGNYSLSFAFRFYLSKVGYSLHQTVLITRPSIVAIGKVRYYRHTDYGLLVSAAAVGIIIGLFSVLFHSALTFAGEIFRDLAFRSEKIFRWEFIAFPLIPAFGGLCIGLLKRTIFHGATIEGLGTVVEALTLRNGKIDWRNSFKSIIFAALSIGSGGGAGREGPTIVLGASLGSTFAQILRLKPKQIRVLCGSGAAAAIAGIFNAPLGGIVFALEAIIGETSIRTFVPLVISSVLSTATARILVGDTPLLITPQLESVELIDYLFLAIAGMLSGFVAVYFLKMYSKVFKFVNSLLVRFSIPEIMRPAIGGFFAGIILLFLPTMWETTYSPINYAIAGKVDPQMKDSILNSLSQLFTGEWIIAFWIIIAIATILIKPISNAITLGSGGAGGTMAPSIKTGAMFGFCFGTILTLFVPTSSPGLYALVCSGAVLAATYQIPLTGGIILFEISRNYDLILPLIFSSVFASFIVQKMKIETFNPLKKSIYYDSE